MSDLPATTMFDVKQKHIGAFTHRKYSKIRGTANKFNEYFNLINDLLDADKRDVALYQQGFKWLLTAGEKLLGCKLSEHPVLGLHKAHLAVLWRVFGAWNEQKNTRRMIETAIGLVEQVHAGSQQFAKKYGTEQKRLTDRIESKLKGKPFYWNTYVQDLRRHGFSNSSREDIIEECHFISRERVPAMWTAISTEVKELQNLTRCALVEYAAIAAYCSTISSLVCKYDGRVANMRRSKSTVHAIAGGTLMKERLLDQVPNGSDARSRATRARQDPAKAARNAAEIAQRCVDRLVWTAERSKTLHILGHGIPGGVVFPWDIAKRRGINVPMLQGLDLTTPIRRFLDSYARTLLRRNHRPRRVPQQG